LVTEKVSVVLRLNMTETTDQHLRIKQHAHDLFMQFGLKSVSMDDIANKLGISKKTIYQYYTDKDQLVNDVVNTIIKQNQETCNIDRSRASDAVHEIFLAMDMMLEMFRSMNPFVLHDMQKYYPTAFQIFLNHKNDYLYGVIKENIERGIKEELYRNDINVEVMARFRVESIVIPFHTDFHTKVKSPLAEIGEEIALHFLFGVASQKGYKQIIKYKENRQLK